MSWIDQGRQGHGWFGHGTSAQDASSQELRGRVFAIVNLAADSFGVPRDRVPFAIPVTTDTLRTLAPAMAPHAAMDFDPFRQRFLGKDFDPVDAWAIQRVMRDVARSETHGQLLAAGNELAQTIVSYGPRGWAALMETATASFNAELKSTASAGASEASSSASGSAPALAVVAQAKLKAMCIDKCSSLALPTRDDGVSFGRCVSTCMGTTIFREWERHFPK